jgi:flagellar biosynthetic protein FliO
MEKLKGWAGVLCIIFLLNGTTVQAASGLMYLSPVKTRTTAEGTQVLLTFQGKPDGISRLDETALSDGDGWIQMKIPGSYIDPPKQSIRLNKGPLTEVFAYQFDDNTVHIRLYGRDAAKGLRDRVSLKSSGQETSLIIRSGPSVLTASPASSPVQAISEADSKIQTTPPESSPDPDPTVQTFNPSLSTPVEETKPNAPLLPAVSEGRPDFLMSSMKMAGALALVLALMLGCFYLFKKTLGKKMGVSGKNRLIQVISSAYLGPKKSIVLVEVSGERLVIGVSGDQLVMLTRIVPEDDLLTTDETSAPAEKENVVRTPPNRHGFEAVLSSVGQDAPSGEGLWSQKQS